MKARNTRLKFLAMVIAPVAAAAIWTAGGARRAAAHPPPTGDRQVFGLLGITSGQTARLNAFNPPPEPDQPPPIGDMPIQVEMTIFDGEGNVLAHSLARLGPGHSSSLSVDRDMLPPVGSRVDLAALVKVSPPPEGDHPADQRRRTSPPVVSTLEVIENATSRTSFVLQPPPTGD